jgi:8-amino-7-oxononanoate synthase
MASRLRSNLTLGGLNTGKSTTQIVPVILGEECRSLSLVAKLEKEGYYTVAIRPPTVPAGTSRLRLAVSSMHNQEEIDEISKKIIQFAHESC